VGFVIGYIYLEETLQKDTPPGSPLQLITEESTLLPNPPSPHQPVDRTFKETLSMVFSIPVMSAVLPYNVMCFLQVIYDEVLALWAVTPPKDGGLSFTSTEIGWSLSYMGVLCLFIQILCYPPLQIRYGNLACYRWGMLGYVLVFVTLPNVSFFALEAEKGRMSIAWMWIFLFAIYTLRVFSAVFVFTSSMLFVSTAGRRLRSLGLLNGVAQCGAGLVRAIGPALGGTMWSWSLLNGLSYPFDYHFVYYILGMLALLAFSQTFSLAKYMQQFEDPYARPVNGELASG
jgi:hypothetical protein